MALTDHPNYSVIDKERKGVFEELDKAQKKRLQDGKTLLQCCNTPETIPGGNSKQSFDKNRKVADESEDWNAMDDGSDFSSLVAEGSLCQYYVHRYDGPNGSGIIFGCRVDYDGATWRYEEHDGPEVGRSGPFDEWVQVDDGE